jgi:hypothetical protein
MQAALEHANDECIHEKSGQTTCSHNRVHLCLGRALDDILRGLPRAAANGDDDMPPSLNGDKSLNGDEAILEPRTAANGDASLKGEDAFFEPRTAAAIGDVFNDLRPFLIGDPSLNAEEAFLDGEVTADLGDCEPFLGNEVSFMRQPHCSGSGFGRKSRHVSFLRLKC